MAILLPPSGSDDAERTGSDTILSTVTQEKLLLPVVALRDTLVFPGTESVLSFGRKRSVQAIREAHKNGKPIVLVAQRRLELEDPKEDDLYTIGTVTRIDRLLPLDKELNALVRGQQRVKIVSYQDSGPYPKAQIEILKDNEGDKEQLEALSKHLMTEFKKAVNLGKSVEFLNFMKLMSGVSAGELSDLVSATLDLTIGKKQSLLEITDVVLRITKVIEYLSKEIRVLEIERSISNKTQKRFDKHIREQVLRERLRTIQKELGEDDSEEGKELEELEKAIESAKMPKKVKEKALKELRRLERMSINNPEGGYIRTWLETLTELPWNKRSKRPLSLTKAESILNADQYGLKEVKDRILEYLAVMKLKAKRRASSDKKDRKLPTILCFVGPPGVGKTSIGKSIAKALGREFVKVSLGGMRDEAEIRGHRRTYVGAMPGRVISGMKAAGTINPVFMLDEIDKVGTDFRGDPSSALLEALDPEQNHEFSDHYLEVPYDLSEVLFIATANVLDTIPPALRDRLEVIRYAGYSELEKFHIAKQHLIEKVRRQNGLTAEAFEMSDDILKQIIQLYTREAGVRSLERMLNRVARKQARSLASSQDVIHKITTETLEDYLGPAKYLPVLAEKSDEVGITTGLAWTSVGGEILFVEVSLFPGKGQVILTGQLGKVMQESARAALTFVRSNVERFGIDPEKMRMNDLHVHVPEGAVPKDGPSAGVTMATSIVSAFTGRKVRKNVAMTGEITLRGKVLEIGGLKEKANAAHRAGIQEVIIPWANVKDLREISDHVKKDIQFHPVKELYEVIELALLPIEKNQTKKIATKEISKKKKNKKAAKKSSQ